MKSGNLLVPKIILFKSMKVFLKFFANVHAYLLEYRNGTVSAYVSIE